MSTIKVNSIKSTSSDDGGIGINSSGHVSVHGLNMPGSGALTFRNKIINGAMRVAQRGSSFTGITSGENYPADRFRFYVDYGTFDAIRSTTAPSGFGNSIKIDCTSTGTPGANDENYVEQTIEAINLQDLKYGESDAESITLSFYVRSNKTGSYGLWLYSEDGQRQYATTYTISTADTFEYKTITIPGDTAGTINNDVGVGLVVRWYLGAGTAYAGTPAETWETVGSNRTTSLNLADNTSNEWLLSGVQLEVGSVATPFEHIDQALLDVQCQRYYYQSTSQGREWGPWVTYLSNGDTRGRVSHPNQMRITPVITFSTTTWRMLGTSSTAEPVNVNLTGIVASSTNTKSWGLNTNSLSGYGTVLAWGSNSNVLLKASAEFT